MGSAHVASGGHAPPVFGPDHWENHLRGHASGGNVELLNLDPDEDDSMEVSDAVTERLLSFDKDEESEFTLSEVSSISSDKINVSKEPPATKSVSVTPSWPVSSLPSPVSSNPVVGINPAVPRPFKSVRPPSLRVCPRPRLPNSPK